jgi:hypothetical protein
VNRYLADDEPAYRSHCGGTADCDARAYRAGENHDNVLSKLYKSLDDVEISITTFGGGPIERFTADGDSVPTDWRTGQPNTSANFIACSQIQVVYGGVNLTTPTACATTTFS